MFFSFLLAFLQRAFFFTGAVNGSYPKPLSREEEKEYLDRKEKGDLEARDILIRHNMRLVAHIAKKYSGAAEQDDLISVGTIGLIKAIGTYSQGKGTTLSTYTARCIENEILMLLRAGKKHKNVISLTDPVGEDKEGNELTLMDLLSEKEDQVFESVEKSIVRERLEKTMKEVLSEREQLVLSLRFGFSTPPLPQREVGKKLKISRSYVSRIEKRAIEKLKEALSLADFGNE